MVDIPAGFELDDPTGGAPAIPPGFELDTPTMSPQQFAQTFAARAKETGDPRDIADQIRAEQEAARKTPTLKSDRFTMGTADPAYGAAQLATHLGAAVAPSLAPYRNAVDQSILSREDKYNANRQAAGETGLDGYRMTGNLLGTAPLMFAGPSGAANSLMGAMGQGGLLGAENALVTPVTDHKTLDGGGYGSKKAIDTLLGTAAGAGTSGLLYGTGKIISPNPSKEVGLLQDSNVPLTLGQISGGAGKSFEDKLTSVPGVGDAIVNAQNRGVKAFNVAAINRGLEPLVDAISGANPTIRDNVAKEILYDGPAGREGVRYLGDTLSKGFDDVKSKISMPVTDEIMNDLAGIADKAGQAKPAISKQVQDFVTSNIFDRTKDGVLSGQAFKDVENAITNEAKQYSKSMLGDDQKYARALYDVADTMREHLAATNPEQAPVLKALNKGWAILARIENAVPTGSADGIFTPYNLARATETADSSVRHRAYVRGEALLQDLTDAGLKVLGNKFPNSGTADRSMVASLFKSTPSALGVLGTGAGAIPYLSPMQRGISNLLSRRSGQIAPLLGEAVGSAAIPGAQLSSAGMRLLGP